MTWRRIAKEAPKVGTVVLLWKGGGEIPIAGYSDSSGVFHHADCGSEFWPQPTHWMPLPKPPEQQP